VERSTPSETKKGAGSRGGVGNVKAPASPTRVRVRRIKERENVKRQLSRMLRIGTDGHFITEPLGTSWLEDGADVAVLRRLPRRKRYTGIRRAPRENDILLGCSGRTTLRRGSVTDFLILRLSLLCNS
jgi:hypothetical protein